MTEFYYLIYIFISYIYAACISDISVNYKYFSVAQSLNVSESSVKRTFSKMYGKLDVKGKIEFLEEVKSLATPEEKEFLNLDDFFDNP